MNRFSINSFMDGRRANVCALVSALKTVLFNARLSSGHEVVGS